MDILAYVLDHALVLIPVLNVIGLILKSIIEIPNKFIPLILLVFGLAGSIAIMGFSVQSLIQGILVTGAAVYGNQVVKQLSNK